MDKNYYDNYDDNMGKKPIGIFIIILGTIFFICACLCLFDSLDIKNFLIFFIFSSICYAIAYFILFYKKPQESDNDYKYKDITEEKSIENYLANKQQKENYEKELEQAKHEYAKKMWMETIDNIPKCPTCHSTNIKKISTTSKIIGAYSLGLFSKNATSQFKCNNCGYKW